MILLLMIIFDWSGIAHSEVSHEAIVINTVDDFETPGEWVAKFSKFRSKNWEDSAKKPFQDSNAWIKWLNSSSYKKGSILPEAVQKNPYLRDKEKTILAVRGKWDVSGYNWLVIEPNAIRPSKEYSLDWLRLVAKNKTFKPMRTKWDKSVNPNFIWLSGNTKHLYIYVWGGNYNYKIECHLQDYMGNTHSIPFGDLNFKGWRKMRISIPFHIKQKSKSLPSVRPLKFLRFKIIADPYENPSEFYTYFDYFHVVTDIYEESYVGEELQFVYNYWDNGNKNPAPKK